jgi:hypothetical protein
MLDGTGRRCSAASSRRCDWKTRFENPGSAARGNRRGIAEEIFIGSE